MNNNFKKVDGLDIKLAINRIGWHDFVNILTHFRFPKEFG
jgi:hypothetical protein